MAVVTFPIGHDALPRLPRPVMVWRGLICGVGVLAVVVALGRAVAPGAPPATVTHAVSAPAPAYPYQSTTRVGPWGFTTRHAGDYVAWRFFERDVAFHATMSGPTGTSGRFGDPATWATNAAGIGFKVDTVPRAGAIAQWNAGEQGAAGAGHVAYVERVGPDGSVVVAEFDWSVPKGYSQREGVRAPRYIHIQDR
ncbi:MAG TPA: CHAP domain-containing protein [Acidimicrobiales bacterium]|nr:CHAP domain-containing protein [Acidimicrobiales bacterium]